MDTKNDHSVDERDIDIAKKVKAMGKTIQPEDVAKFRAVWPTILKEIGKLEDRTGASVHVPRSAEDLLLAMAGVQDEKQEQVLKNVNLSVIPLTDELRRILNDLRGIK